MVHSEVLDLCLEKFRQLDAHIVESLPVREDVINLKKSVEHLQSEYSDLILKLNATEKKFLDKLETIETKLLNRPPAWVGVAFTVMGSIITGLAVFVLTR